MVDGQNSLKIFYGSEYVNKFEKDIRAHQTRVNRLIEQLEFPKYYEVVDFGCGSGILMESLYNKVRFYSGIDFSEFFIEAARQRQNKLMITNAEFFCETIESFCSRNPNKFDAGFVFDVAEHVYDKELSSILAAICQSMKTGAKLYIHTPNAEFFIEIMKKENFIFHQIIEHIAVRNAREMIQLLKNAGFSKCEVKMLPHYNILRFLHFLSFCPYVGKYFEARIFIIAEK
jgi:2-polyprenyl-3-methyl-5-hydroxy-6-metoxy-1,4-benzoquinol methylase